jgi:hypothetical protein
MSEAVRKIVLGDVSVVVSRGTVATYFSDGTSSVFYPPVDSWEFRGQAFGAGYCDPTQFGIEHDLAHSFLAHVRGKPYSDVVWAEAHGISQQTNQKLYDDEEHLVYRMQRYANTGEEDREFGLLRKAFGDLLPAVAVDLIKFWRFSP